MSGRPLDHSRVENVIAGLAEAGAKKPRGQEAIPPAQSAGSKIGSTTGSANASASEAGTGQGIASPLTERDASLRTYHPAQDVYDEDGTLVKIHPIKSMVLHDANGNQVEQNFDMPNYAGIV